ncbi:MAG: NAD(P)-dependent oxidoreductase [Betaproteobacteria bacterium]|nr:NAD(P)-dependent oxidoreductase [Betaproteobacteria bacterium]
MSSIGVIGAGLMGMAMAERLQACGQQVYLCDVDPARQALGRSLGMQVETAPAALALQCSRILIVVLDALQVEDRLHRLHLRCPIVCLLHSSTITGSCFAARCRHKRQALPVNRSPKLVLWPWIRRFQADPHGRDAARSA